MIRNNDSSYLSSGNVPDIDVSTLHMLYDLVLIVTLQSMYLHYPHFTHEEPEAKSC